jgi:hypothetical protein
MTPARPSGGDRGEPPIAILATGSAPFGPLLGVDLLPSG